MTEESAFRGEKRIVVGVDGSPSSVAALRRALAIADAVTGYVEAVIAWQVPYFVPALVLEDWSPSDDAHAVLERTTAVAYHGRNLPHVRLQVREGPAARVLIDESRDAYLLVVGSRGHGGFAGLLLGSVSAHCAAHASCPVLIMHGDDVDALEEELTRSAS